MISFNENLNIPAELQAVVSEIENIPMHLAEIPMAEHPKLPQFNRFLMVTKIDANAENEFVHFDYKQILKDKETGEVYKLNLPMPAWDVYATTWSYFRGTDNKPVSLPIKEGSEETENKLRVPSMKYMLWLMANNKAGFLQLIEGYAADFVRLNMDALNEL